MCTFATAPMVQAGDLLFTLDGRQIEAEIKRVEAVIAGAMAQLEQAERDVERYTELVAKNATTQVTLNNAQTAGQYLRARSAASNRASSKTCKFSSTIAPNPRADFRPHQRGRM